MEIHLCVINGKPAFKCGHKKGVFYTFDENDDNAKEIAKQKAIDEGLYLESLDQKTFKPKRIYINNEVRGKK